jgi:hypothetical protein
MKQIFDELFMTTIENKVNMHLSLKMALMVIYSYLKNVMFICHYRQHICQTRSINYHEYNKLLNQKIKYGNEEYL